MNIRQYVCFSMFYLFTEIPTAEVLRRDHRASWVAVHLFSLTLHAEMSSSTCVGFAADLISERHLAQ